MKAVVHVTLKPEVLDPQGKAILRASASLGYEAVRAVRQGKVFEIELDDGDDGDEGGARGQLEELCQKLLANPVIEDYRILSLE
ncbi:MAG: phosphoribosylformylglycinamidine synthase subunit PurS [Myxococcota bacterium]|nr:phosphoribosylformylglycinamidine synthase subunit PurS [Myxococcota bacterium]